MTSPQNLVPPSVASQGRAARRLPFAFGRRFFLKDTGRKLAHFDRELNAGRTPMPPHLHREELN